MNRAVFDTNVVVSGFLSPDGPPGRIVEWLRSGALVAVVDSRIYGEYAEVLARPTFGLPPTDVELVLKAIAHHAQWVEAAIARSSTALPDPDDLPFWECARTAQVPLVTGNVKHFPQQIVGKLQVVTSGQFLARLTSR